MARDGRDSIKTSMQPCFHYGPSGTAIQKEKREKFLRKEIKSIQGKYNFD